MNRLATAEAEAIATLEGKPTVCRMVKPPAPDRDEDDEQIEAPKQHRRVAICGTSSTTAGLAPVNVVDKDGKPLWEIWTLGIAQKFYSRQDRHFQLHNLDEGARRWSENYKAWLNTTKTPVYLQELNPAWVPAGVSFPLAEIMQAFPLSGSYFTCMIAEMIALAIMEGVDELGIYGCDLAHASEYAYQRPCVDHWIGIAIGRGINVVVPKESDLLKCAQIYGYETHGGSHQSGFSRCIERRDQEVTARYEQYAKQAKDIERAMYVLQGAQESNRYYRNWLGHDLSHTGTDHVLADTAPEKVLHLSDGKP